MYIVKFFATNPKIKLKFLLQTAKSTRICFEKKVYLPIIFMNSYFFQVLPKEISKSHTILKQYKYLMTQM